MVGITAYGAYIPLHRLSRRKFTEAFGEPAVAGEKAVANFDEDSVTMATAAAMDCLKGMDRRKIGAVYFATTCAPYREKQAATIIAAALDLGENIRTADFTDSLRAGAAALAAAADAVKNGTENVLVCTADCRLGAPQGSFEQLSGDGAAAFIVGGSNVVASLEDRVSVAREFTGSWRTARDSFVRSWEERFVIGAGYHEMVREAGRKILLKGDLTPPDFTKIVLTGPGVRHQINAAKALGFSKAQIQDDLSATIGNTGTAHGPMMLVAALEEATPGDRLLVLDWGEGSDAHVFVVTEGIGALPGHRGIRGHLEPKENTINYQTYLKWRDLLPVEAARRPERKRPSVPALWRGEKKNLALYGSKCQACGTPQYPPQRVCVHCGCKDEMTGYRFIDKKASVTAFTIDYLTASRNPPTVFAVLDFEGGGRMICELTDANPANVHIAMEVEPTFRRLYEAGGIHNYAWKFRPAR